MLRPKLTTALAVAVAALCAAGPADAAPTVTVFPTPGSRYVEPQAQIVIRGVSPGAIGTVRVTGSQTGQHALQFRADADGQGASLFPAVAFAPGETVRVTTGLNVVDGRGGTFSFRIAHPTGLIPYHGLPVVANGPGGTEQFHSRPDLQPPGITVTKNSAPASEGDIFVASQNGPVQSGPMILDPSGNLIWFLPRPVSENLLVTNFRVQSLNGQPVLTWWQGNTNGGQGRGVGIIFNHDYQQIDTVRAGDGLDADLHEFRLTPQGDAYITATFPVRLPGFRKAVIDSVVQEIEIRTGNVLFDWDALDHIPVSEAYAGPSKDGNLTDPYHINSVMPDGAGNLIVSMRSTSAVYDVDHRTGAVLWTLGGKRSTFRMGSGTSTWEQHNAELHSDGTLTLFDDGAGPPQVHPFSRGVHERLDFAHRTATLIQQYGHAPSLSANFEGSMEPIPDGNVFLGWGQQPYFSEDNASGSEIFDAHFNVPTTSYRAYRQPWSAQPPTHPALAVTPNADGSLWLYGSWNGATDVSGWRVNAGSSPTGLAFVGSAPKHGFETAIRLHSGDADVAVQPLSSSGRTLSSSATIAVPPHVAIYGPTGFTSNSGALALPAGCFMPHNCQVTTTVTAGRTTIARTRPQSLPAGSHGNLWVQLSSQGVSLLGRAHGSLGVQVTARDSSGVTAGTPLTLREFGTSGNSPPRGSIQSSAVKVFGLLSFVSGSGNGGLLTECSSPTPCHVTTTVSAGSSVIAHTGPEFIGGNELAYLSFSLTATGRQLLAHARGNQLGAHVSLSSSSGNASADVVLIRAG